MKRILPQYLKCMSYYPTDKYEFILSKTDSISSDLFRKINKQFPAVKPIIIESDNYALMKYSKVVVATSGTATLETAYIGTPFIIVYKASPVSYQIGKRIVKIKRIGLPNIILDSDLAPELIQGKANHNIINREIKRLLKDDDYYSHFKESLQNLHDLLGKKPAGSSTASIVENLINENA